MDEDIICCAGCEYAECKSFCMSAIAGASKIQRDYKDDVIGCSSGRYSPSFSIIAL